ncbi:MAG: ATP-dependent metallopeptidase FtsH/Yme1/Tma family protein [Bryobacteraceae bacterium]
MNETESSPKKHDRVDEKKRQAQSRRQLHFGISYLITSLIVLWLFQLFVLTLLTSNTEIPYSEFKKKLAAAQIVKVTIGERGIVGEMKPPKPDGTGEHENGSQSWRLRFGLRGGAARHHLSRKQRADQGSAHPLPDVLAVCGRPGARSGRPVWRHQGGPGDSRPARPAGPHPD